MTYLRIAPSLLVLLALVTTDARAAEPHQGVQIINNNYVSNNNVGPNTNRRNYDHDYRSSSDRRYPSYPDRGYRGRGLESHSAAVARIKATHSRFRNNYHPRSYHNSPPHYYDWRGW